MLKVELPYKWEPGMIMLHPKYYKGCVLHSSALYLRDYKDTWFTDDFNIRCVTDIDKMSMIVPGIFHHDYYGNVSHDKVSGGAMSLIAQHMVDGYTLPISNLGHNCVELLYELSLKKELHYYYQSYLPNFVSEQRVLDLGSGLLFTGDEANTWERLYAPDNE